MLDMYTIRKESGQICKKHDALSKLFLIFKLVRSQQYLNSPINLEILLCGIEYNLVELRDLNRRKAIRALSNVTFLCFKNFLFI